MCLTKIKRINSKSKHSDISGFAICNEASPTKCKFACNKRTRSLAKIILVSDKDKEEQEGDHVDCNRTFEASFYSSVPYLLTQGDLNDLVLDLYLSKKHADGLGSRL